MGPQVAEAAGWHRHPYTRALAKRFRTLHLDVAYSNLMRYAAASSDAQVRAACVEFEEWERFVRFLESEAKELNDE